ncbi:hypothetical protein OND84_002699 [Morganella morganii]|uniref:hypothetical protein n=1 Tax=Providencia huaxiensis TaxID=2027290 RepID=UPI002ADEA47B|nr:hypothetical protein [Morganella morganii]
MSIVNAPAFKACLRCNTLCQLENYNPCYNTYTLDCSCCGWHLCQNEEADTCPKCISQSDDIALREYGVKDRTEAFKLMAKVKQMLSSVAANIDKNRLRKKDRNRLEDAFMVCVHLDGTSYCKGFTYRASLDFIYRRYMQLAAAYH